MPTTQILRLQPVAIAAFLVPQELALSQTLCPPQGAGIWPPLVPRPRAGPDPQGLSTLSALGCWWGLIREDKPSLAPRWLRC